MKTSISFLSIVFFLVTLFSCCEETYNPVTPKIDRDSLPPITTEGLNTCGYKVNGEIVQYRPAWGNKLSIFYIPSSGIFQLKCEEYPHFMSFTVDSVFGVGRYNLKAKKINGTRTGHRGIYSRLDSSYSFTNNVGGGIDILRMDIDTLTPKYIISGTFYFSTTSDDLSIKDSFHITEGRFDIIKE